MQLGYLGLIGLHHQRAVGIEELGNGFGELSFPLLLGSAADERHLQGVFVIKPAGPGKAQLEPGLTETTARR